MLRGIFWPTFLAPTFRSFTFSLLSHLIWFTAIMPFGPRKALAHLSTNLTQSSLNFGPLKRKRDEALSEEVDEEVDEEIGE